MTTPWTPPGAGLPESAPGPPSAPLPPLPKYPTGAPVTEGYYGGPPPPQGPPPSKTLAGWALGLAIFGCSLITWILGAIFAVQVLVESRREQRDHGRAMAIAALVLLGGWAVVGALVIASGALGRIEIGEDLGGDDPALEGQVLPSQLEVGDCFDDPTLAVGSDDGETVESGLVTLTACERPHDLEAFLVSDLLGGQYPGLEDLKRQSAETCDPAFRVYVGKPVGRSELAYWLYYPSEQDWSGPAGHRITCVVGDPGAKTSGSLRDSDR